MKYKKDGMTVKVPKSCKRGNHVAARWTEYDPHAWRCWNCGKDLSEGDIIDELVRQRKKIRKLRRALKRTQKLEKRSAIFNCFQTRKPKKT